MMPTELSAKTQPRVMSNVFHTEEIDSDNAKTALSFRDYYLSLFNNTESASLKSVANDFLTQQLQQTRNAEPSLPKDASGLLQWLNAHTELVGKQYQQYLADRQNGAPRRYFTNKSHALFFIKTVAPTKLVDGAWLYGFTRHCNDERFSGLIKTYLEELGDGLQQKNHVALYKKLLNSYGLSQSDVLDDIYYQQGAIQLALGRDTDEFMPEAIGFNLGYEQLPLHLLITAYELKELGIDSYYFTLHVTIDNASSGHAKQAVQSVLDNMPQLGDVENYFARVSQGFQLNDLGAGTETIIAAFDLEQELMSLLRNKAEIGKYMHGNHCNVEGQSINEWLADGEKMPQFMAALQANGWIRRHQDPAASRFWKLIDNDKAMMFGVFTPYEKQVIYDWIAGDWIGDNKQADNTSNRIKQAAVNASKPAAVLSQPDANADASTAAGSKAFQSSASLNHHDAATNIFPFRTGHLNPAHLPQHPSLQPSQQVRLLQPSFLPVKQSPVQNKTWEQDAALLVQQISACANEADKLQLLTHWMAPATHHTVIGLKATQLYKTWLQSNERQV